MHCLFRPKVGPAFVRDIGYPIPESYVIADCLGVEDVPWGPLDLRTAMEPYFRRHIYRPQEWMCRGDTECVVPAFTIEHLGSEEKVAYWLEMIEE